MLVKHFFSSLFFQNKQKINKTYEYDYGDIKLIIYFPIFNLIYIKPRIKRL